MGTWTIERLAKTHDRQAFRCDDGPLDLFLKTLATQYEKKRLGRTFVATRPDETIVCGFYTVASGSFVSDFLPAALRKRLPKHPVPTVHLGRLGVDMSCRGLGLGQALLFHCNESIRGNGYIRRGRVGR